MGQSTTHDESESRLLRQAAARNSTALECLLLRHHQFLLSFLNRRVPVNLRRVMEARDLLQDVYFDAFQHIRQFTATDHHSAKRWLLVIARNRLNQTIRAYETLKRGSGRGAMNAMEHFADPARGAVIRLLQDLAVDERTPSRSAASHELLDVLRSLVEQLAPRHREAIRLRYIDGLNCAQIAAKLNTTERAVHMLCNRGLASLRTQMQSASHYW